MQQRQIRSSVQFELQTLSNILLKRQFVNKSPANLECLRFNDIVPLIQQLKSSKTQSFYLSMLQTGGGGGGGGGGGRWRPIDLSRI